MKAGIQPHFASYQEETAFSKVNGPLGESIYLQDTILAWIWPSKAGFAHPWFKHSRSVCHTYRPIVAVGQLCDVPVNITIFAFQLNSCGLVLCHRVTSFCASDPGGQRPFRLRQRVAGSVITGSKYILLCSNSCQSRDDSDAYEFRFLHIVVSNVYHAETVCNVLIRLWKAAFSNHVCRSLRVVLAFAWMLC